MKKSVLAFGVLTLPVLVTGVAISSVVKRMKRDETKEEPSDDLDCIDVNSTNCTTDYNLGVAKKDNLDAEFNRVKNSINYDEYSTKKEFLDSEVEEAIAYLKASDEFAAFRYPHINKYIVPLLSIFNPKTYEELKRVIAIGFGTGTWDNGGKTVFCDKKTDLYGLVSYRESVIDYLLKQGLDENVVLDIVSSIEYGRVKQGKCEKYYGEWHMLMLEKNVPEWYIWLCAHIDYLINESAAEYYTNLFLSRLLVSKSDCEENYYEDGASIEEDA